MTDTPLPDHELGLLSDVVVDQIRARCRMVSEQIDRWQPRPCPPRDMDAINGTRRDR